MSETTVVEIGAVNPQLDALKDVEKKMAELQAERDAVRENIRANMVPAVVVFVDMVGSTEFKVKNANQPWVWILRVQQFTQVMAEYIEKLKGEVAKYIGDEVMAVFRGKDALDDAMSLVARCKSIEEDLKAVTGVETRIKIALDKGSVYLLKFEGHNVLDPQGSAVDRCARIAKFAQPGVVLASADVALNSGDSYQWALAGEVPAKGLGTIAIYQLGKATVTVREMTEVVKAEHDILIERDREKSKRIGELESQAKKLEEMNRTLQGEVLKSGGKPSAANSVEDDSADEDRYEELLDAVKRTLRNYLNCPDLADIRG